MRFATLARICLYRAEYDREILEDLFSQFAEIRIAPTPSSMAESRNWSSLPREIRDMIYGHALASDRASWNRPRVHHLSSRDREDIRSRRKHLKDCILTSDRSPKANAAHDEARKAVAKDPKMFSLHILRLNKEIRAEAEEYIFDKMRVKIIMHRYEELDVPTRRALMRARDLEIEYHVDYHSCRPIDEGEKKIPCLEQLELALSFTRRPLRSFAFAGKCTFPKLESPVLSFKPFIAIYEATVLSAMEQMPLIKASEGVSMTWEVEHEEKGEDGVYRPRQTALADLNLRFKYAMLLHQFLKMHKRNGIVARGRSGADLIAGVVPTSVRIVPEIPLELFIISTTSKRQGIFSTQADFPNKKYKMRTRAQTRKTTSLWRFPREIRENIYKYVFDAPLRPIDHIQAVFNGSSLIKTGILLVNHQVREEASEYIYKNVEVQFFAHEEWGLRKQALLSVCRHITVIYDDRRISDALHLWQTCLWNFLGSRDDLRTFRLEGVGDVILGYLNRTVEHDPVGFYAIMDLLAFERTMLMLSKFPAIKARDCIEVHWDGADELPEGEEYVDEYRDMVKRIESGEGGSGEIRTSPLLRYVFR